jgi:heat shock protein HslJ
MDKNREQTLLIIAGMVIATILICGVGSLFIGLFGATRFVMAPAAITVLPLTPTTAVSLPPALDGTEWLLVSLNGRSPLPNTRLTLTFSQGEVSGFSGCNWYDGAYTISAEGGLTIPEIASTTRDCPEIEGVLAQEAVFQEALWKAASYRFQDNQIEINNAAGETTLAFQRQ